MDISDVTTLTIVNNAALNMGVHISLQDNSLFPLNVYPEVELLDHMAVLVLIF